jgi:hypothetical protein
VVCGSTKDFAARTDEDDMTTNPEASLIPFGKHRGKSISEVLRQDPSYLGCLCNEVDGNEVLKRAIRLLPGFPQMFGKYFSQKRSVRKPDQEPDFPNMGVAPHLSREQLGGLCREILNPPVEK